MKNKLEVEHTHHRSSVNFLVHIFSTLISYSLKRKTFYFQHFLYRLIHS
ncbi:MAG: hypothetical protein ACR5KV_06625 [Wolbachia sp.]